jgi:murein DD-endopeptidase MepM/ murein hydrolase activator NlpD
MESHTKYYYDTSDGKYRPASRGTGARILNAVIILLLSVSIAIVLVIIYGQFHGFPDELYLKDKVENLESNYQNLEKQLTGMDGTLASIEERDDSIYRQVLGAQPIDKSIRDAGVGGSDRYADIRQKKIAHKDLIIALHEKADRLRRKLYIESTSQEYVLRLAEQKAIFLASIPSIQPISNEDLVACTSGFGIRMHAIRKVKKMHKGIDLSAIIGTPVYATADGTIAKVDTRARGYGKLIKISHGFGYETRYAHLSRFAVNEGNTVKRGDLIGYVGTTGLSTGPHLHYEILIYNQQVNPIEYFFVN